MAQKKKKHPEISNCPVCGYETDGIIIAKKITCAVCGRKFRSGHGFFNRKINKVTKDGKD